MATYRYKANKKQARMLMVAGPIEVVVGLWLLFSNYVLTLGFGDHAPSLGLIGSKIVWAGVVIVGVFSMYIGFRSNRLGEQQVLVSDDAVTLPKGEFSDEMVTLRPGDITGLKTFVSQDNRSLVIKYNGGKTRLTNHRFDSLDAYEAMIADVSAVADVPAVPSKLSGSTRKSGSR